MSAGDVTYIVMSSAYAVTTVFLLFLSIVMPGRVACVLFSRGCKHRANKYILKGHPCLMDDLIGIGLVM
jgi:hypothetical protein